MIRRRRRQQGRKEDVLAVYYSAFGYRKRGRKFGRKVMFEWMIKVNASGAAGLDGDET